MNSYGPAGHPEKCAPKECRVMAVRSNAGAGSVDIVIVMENGDQQWLRCSGNEIAGLAAACRRTLGSLLDEKSASWSPDSAVLAEVRDYAARER